MTDVTSDPADALASADALAFEQIFNFRDFGGVETRDGSHVRRGRLFRSANLARATEGDQARLRQLGVQVAVDLRRPSERAAEPSRWPEDAPPRFILSGDNDDRTLPPHLQYFAEGKPITADATRAYMLDAYKRIPFEDRHIAMFRDGFAALARDETPLLVHCAAGKDRTGVFCALVLRALDVDDAHIIHDYLLTNHTPQFEAIVQSAVKRFTKKFGRPLDADAVRPMIGVDEYYLNTAKAEMAAQSGSVDGYLTDVLGVDDALRRELRQVLTVPT